MAKNRFRGQWILVVGGPKHTRQLRFSGRFAGLRKAFKTAVEFLLQKRAKVNPDFLRMIGTEACASYEALNTALAEERYAHALRHWNKFRADYYSSRDSLRLEWV